MTTPIRIRIIPVPDFSDTPYDFIRWLTHECFMSCYEAEQVKGAVCIRLVVDAQLAQSLTMQRVQTAIDKVKAAKDCLVMLDAVIHDGELSQEDMATEFRKMNDELDAMGLGIYKRLPGATSLKEVAAAVIHPPVNRTLQ